MKFSKIKEFSLSSYSVPTQTALESDGTLEWTQTTLCLVELHTAEHQALGFSYGNPALLKIAENLLSSHVVGHSAQNLPEIWGNLVRAIRNEGKFGPSAMAISAIDIALWDLRAKELGLSVAQLLGTARSSVEVYGSGGFTSATPDELQSQLIGWKKLGIKKFKMKIGRNPEADFARVQFAREIIGNNCDLMVDANEALQATQALQMAEQLAKLNVVWFEQPIDARDLREYSELRKRFPAGMSLTTGEYIYDTSQTRNLLEAGAADVIQLDVTRCKGITGFMKSAALCEASYIPTSSHCAPTLHVSLGCALPGILHLEYFADHSRIENTFFEGVPEVHQGHVSANWERPGLGLELRRREIERFRQ